MKATGIVRRIDDLGRVAIPREIRRSCGIREGDPLEIYMDSVDGMPVVCFCKYETSLVTSLTCMADRIDDEMFDSATDKQRKDVRDHFNEIAKILKEWENEG